MYSVTGVCVENVVPGERKARGKRTERKAHVHMRDTYNVGHMRSAERAKHT